MSNSYRIRTQVGVDKSVCVYLDQDFEFLEILSLKILQSQIYTRPCSDYGVVVGRVSVNNGFGIPNAKVSIFVPLDSVDENNPIISELYPYQSVSDLNEDGYRYNLLPYTQQHGGHTPTGTFFERTDVLTEPTLIEVYDKYYKYTAKTNESGDYMIFGVPLGNQLLHVDIDLSDIGEFSLSPQDLIRMGRASESQIGGTKFKSSNNLNELPQIVSINRNILVEPLWGQTEICNIGISRCDFDLTDGLNIKIEPTAIFMGSIFSDTNSMALKASCTPRFKQGELCNLVAGPGEILAIRQTIFQDINGRPGLESFTFDEGSQVIDENGAWLVDVPMNLDYVITNEFGQQVLSNDPSKGIPTKAKYRFKIKWNQSSSLSEETKRAYFLVPNVREFGWNQTGGADPFVQSPLSPVYQFANKSYAFSLDWNDYADIQGAIACVDTFYEMKYNKVYSVSQLIDQFRKGTFPNRFVSVKNILDDTCESDNNRFPTNDTNFRGDIIYLLFLFAFIVFRPIIYVLLFVIHVLYALIVLFKYLGLLLIAYVIYLSIQSFVAAAASAPAFGLIVTNIAVGVLYLLLAVALFLLWLKILKLKLKPLNIPILLYDQCEFCTCKDPDDIQDDEYEAEVGEGTQSAGGPPVISPNDSGLQVSQFYLNNYFLPLINNAPQLIGPSNLMAGQVFKYPPTQSPTCASLIPGVVKSTDSNGVSSWWATTSLTLAERINLFNVKAKYFDDDPSNNPGGGVNRIKASFFTGGTMTIGTDAHYDNVVFMMMTPDSFSNLSAGDLITFQDPTMSKDKNVKMAVENEFGNNAITGTSVNLTPYSKTIYFANPSLGSNTNLSVTYTNLQVNTGDTNFHKFPVDIEYFQVITAMTYSSFGVLQNPSSFPNSLPTRILGNTMKFIRILDANQPPFAKNSQDLVTLPLLSTFENYQDQVCVFLVRGVDPYSARQGVTYDLSTLFGYPSYGNVVITGLYKLNQPIVGQQSTPPGLNSTRKFLNVRHDLANNNDKDIGYSESNLYFQSFNYQPDIPQFSGFQSNMPSYYSNLDNNSTVIATCLGCYNNMTSSNTNSSTRGRRTSTPSNNFGGTYVSYGTNAFCLEFDTPFSALGPFNFLPLLAFTPYNNTVISARNRGYFVGEIIEGGSLMVQELTLQLQDTANPGNNTSYYTTAYPTATTVNYPQSIATTRDLVMRSDRLPASTKNMGNCGLSYLLQNNPSLGIYKIPDEGVLSLTSQQPFGAITQGTWDGQNFESKSLGSDLIDSLNSCQDSVPLKCYKYDAANKEYFIQPGTSAPCQSSDYAGSPKDIWVGGCYLFVTRILASIPTDLMLLTEWLARINITFAACRNVFSHSFTNNWINGTLYAFAFKNNRIFNNLNIPDSEYCKKVVHLDLNTNNFYYRSSPYFSGSPSQQFFCADANTANGPQKANLKYPTTMIDLGPRTDYLQQLVMSDDFDGYVINQINTTTFGDTSDLLNIFILSRLVNTEFVKLIFGTGGANIFNYFDKRQRGQVDGDYAQLISTNSQFGVAEFLSENYPSNPAPGAQDPIYFNGGDAKDCVFGVFFSSSTQPRDFISPKRTIIVSSGSPSNNCTYSYFNVFTQEVPFYQWEIFQNEGGSNFDGIFGSQKNTWFTQDLGGNAYYSGLYQKMDRADLTQYSRYFKTSLGLNNQNYYKGYIWGIDNTGDLSADIGDQDFNTPLPRVISVGAPFYFYFGLKKGASSWDLFAKKWIDFENLTE